MEMTRIHRAVLESMSESVYVRDLEMNLIYINPAAARLTGWPLEEARGRKCYEVFGDEHLACKAACPVERAISGEIHVLHHEGDLVTRSGEFRRMNVSITPFPDNGTIIGAVVVMQEVIDLTDLERTHVKTLIRLEREAAARKETEERLRTLINAMPDIVCFKDGEGRWLEANDADLRLFQLENVDYRGKTDAELAEFSPFYRDAFLACEATDEAAWRAGGVTRGDEVIPRPDAISRILDVIKAPTFHTDGRRKGLVVVGRDITGRRLAETMLENRLERHRLLLETIDTQIWYLTDAETYGMANQAHADFLGLPLESIRFHKLADFLPLAEAAVCTQGNRAVFASRNPVYTEEWLEDAKGERRLIRISKIPKLDGDGNVEFVVCAGTDITDIKRAEETVRRERDFAEKLISTARTIILLLDTEGRIVRFNPYLEELSGYRSAEMAGKDWFETFIAHENADAVRERFKAAIHDTQLRSGCINPIFTKDGREILVEWYDRTLKDAEGGIIGLLAVGQDITERKRMETERLELERRLQQVEKAESLSRMAGAVAHHFNNMLSVVLGNLELAKEEAPQASRKMAEYISDATAGALRATEMSRLMLALLGQTRTAPEVLDISAVCRARLSEAIIPETVVLETDMPDPGPAVKADADQLSRVLAILLENAVEAVGDGPGTVRVSVATTRARDIPIIRRFPAEWQPTADRYVCLTVADTGIGIRPTVLNRIFDPFYTEKFTGRGLGLALALGFVKSFGGCITVESAPGRGSRFRVFWPPSSFSSRHSVHAEVSEPGTGTDGGFVLLVEDEPSVRRMAETFLGRLGHRVITAADGVEALEIFDRRKDDIRMVISDLTMPRMDGWETLTALRALRPDLPVILSSGYDQAQVMALGKLDPPMAFLHKPYNKQALKDIVDQVLREAKGTDTWRP